MSIYNFFYSTKGLGLGFTVVLAYRTVDSNGSRNLKSNIIRRMEALGVASADRELYSMRNKLLRSNKTVELPLNELLLT